MDTPRPSTGHLLIRYATPIAIGAVTLLMLLATLSFAHQEKASAEAKGWLVHTYEVIAHIESLLAKLQDAETGERAYLLTGHVEDLELYQGALHDAPQGVPSARQSAEQNTLPNAPALGPGVADPSLRRSRSILQELAYLRSLTADNPVQQSNLDEMDNVIKELLENLATTIQIRKTQSDTPDIHREKELMDHARALVRIMEAEENHLLTLRSETDAITSSQNTSMIFTGVGLFYVTMVLSICLYQNSRARATAQMLHYTQELEASEE
jgi:CHASE3 domain sensor protein